VRSGDGHGRELSRRGGFLPLAEEALVLPEQPEEDGPEESGNGYASIPLETSAFLGQANVKVHVAVRVPTTAPEPLRPRPGALDVPRRHMVRS
jgi:hypothetical protein